MSKPIAIIDCALEGPSYNCLNKIVEQHNYPFTYHWVSKYGLDSIDKLDKVAGYIIFGSNANVCDRLPWQINLALKMKEIIEANIPVLGICFGHQLMADAYGAKVDLVAPADTGYDGVRQHKVLQDYKGYKKEEVLTTFVTHFYEVKELPCGFTHLSTSSECEFEGIAYKNYISFQGHPEASQHFVDEHVDVVLEEKEKDAGFIGGQEIISRFIDLVRST